MCKCFFRKRRIRKDGSAVPTGFIPMNEIRSALALVDMSVPDWQECAGELDDFCKGEGITLSLIFVDFRAKDRRIINRNAANTLYAGDLNWYGRPRPKKFGTLLSSPFDLYVCLTERQDYFVEYLAKCTKARFKISCRAFEGDPYDFIVHASSETVSGDASDSCRVQGNKREIFITIKDFLAKIK